MAEETAGTRETKGIKGKTPKRVRKCPNCKARPPGVYGNCPYQSDVHNDNKFRCRCCDQCAQECARNI